MKYLYFVSYQYQGSNVLGRVDEYGDKTVILQNRITTAKQLDGIRKEIKQQHKAVYVRILFFTLLDVSNDQKEQFYYA